ncbi:MAG: glycosyltransferase [Dehalococcoidales bacterium]|nr:glycosyltransferase [Dehalococcoidales bacterium]
MKLAMVYNPQDSKLRPGAYCSVFRGMFDALIARFEDVQHITEDCSSIDIDADVMFFFDPHSSHHIQIDGVLWHKALKFEYWNDPHQREVRGVYQSTGIEVHKLGHKQRVDRARLRGIDYIVSPVKYAFYDYFSQIMTKDEIDRMLLHFPTAPSFTPGIGKLITRNRGILANGATWGDTENNGYAFRRTVYAHPEVTRINHCIQDKHTPCGTDYGDFLKQYAGALALCEAFPVVKYFEIPLAGCVTFAEYHKEYEELGFRDLRHCIYIDRRNYERCIKDFFESGDIGLYQEIADAGRKLIENNYTAKHFANFIYQKCYEHMEVRVA